MQVDVVKNSMILSVFLILVRIKKEFIPLKDFSVQYL